MWKNYLYSWLPAVASGIEFYSWLTAVASGLEIPLIFMVTYNSFWYRILVMVNCCGFRFKNTMVTYNSFSYRILFMVNCCGFRFRNTIDIHGYLQ